MSRKIVDIEYELKTTTWMKQIDDNLFSKKRKHNMPYEIQNILNMVCIKSRMYVIGNNWVNFLHNKGFVIKFRFDTNGKMN